MGRFVPIQEVVKLPMLGQHDYLMRSKGRFLTWSKYVWDDMNLSTTKVAKREFFDINKRTNTVDLPCDFLQLCSVNVVDKHGVFYPVYLNDRLHDDLVDIAAAKDCACEYKCGYKMCSTIKGYEAVVSTKSDFNPDGTAVSFKCVDRKAVDRNGFFYQELQYPMRVYLSGVWTETVLHTEKKKMCEVEVDSNGCVCDSEENINKICHSCGIVDKDYYPPLGGTANTPPNEGDDTWIYYCNSKADWFGMQCGNLPHGMTKHCNNIYNISELGNRLIFPHDFGFKRVMIRYYHDVNLNDLQIPRIAVDTFVMGLKWWDCKYDDKRQQLAQVYAREYAVMKFGLLREMNKYRIAELGKILAPPRFVPSYVLGRLNNFIVGLGNDYNWGGDYVYP